MVDRAAFEGDALGRFWRFVAERQRVWVRRVVAGEDLPWTDDPVLRDRRFTNVYRVLDPGTQYAVQAILDRDETAPDRAFNDLLYRLVGRLETHEAVGFQRLDAYDADAFERLLRAVDDAADHPVFTGAYVVAPLPGVAGDDKVETVARLFGEIRDGFGRFWTDLVAADGAEGAYRAIRSLPGFGRFLAYQVLVDLLTPLPSGGDSVLPHSPDDWAAAGPGARRGLDLLLDDADGGPDDLAAMRWLHDRQAAEFDRAGLDFEWLRDGSGERIDLSLADVQNCCCEFYKYHDATEGSGGRRRRFDPDDARSTAALRRLYEAYPVSVDAVDYGIA